jgi:ABC-type molybdate transport system permease subunit
MEAVLLLALALSSYVGFALLALSQHRDWQRAGGEALCPAHLVLPPRVVGYGLLLVALAVALLRAGAGFGSLMWATMLSVGAIAGWGRSWH